MKNLVCFVVLCLLAGQCYSQGSAIQFDSENIAYLGIDNPMTVAVENYPLSSVSLTTDNGKITGEFGHYFFSPDHVGNTEIIVRIKTRNGLKVVGRKLVRIKNIPLPTVFLNRQKGGQISKGIIAVQIAPSATIEGNFGFDAKFTIDSFTVIVIRKDKMIFYKALHGHNGTRFDEETSSFFKTLQVNDKLWITDITCFGGDLISRHLQSIDFIIAPDIETEQKSAADTSQFRK